ncbi:SDR family NAD(P)-dependent oxidoreductase [Novosphingobium sp. JCM 18896]|uniref:SDR family NAD(P)-dependent oxidoreductase n=1 Tax=Novosphingobium sp. JCM 18896 TaxID=2989731 RepID=UPI002221A2FE|nr:SDR family oxidoreductase [Novosphingobium sp. JCM 18896]MCW1430541.1 SDR family oxidoreductase [Novosphingobium sp. JCM 18896]
MGLRAAAEAMRGKIAVVVGGAAGHIGRGVTLGLIDEGVEVICCDNDREGLAAIMPEVEALGGKITALYADVTDPASLDAFYDAVAARTDHIDILINVPGGVARSLFDKTTRESHARDIRLNYGYVVDSCHRALPLLRQSGNGGAIVNFTTIEAHRGAATFAVYAGAKAATTNFSRALAVELGKDMIRVNCLASDTSLARASNAALAPEDFARLAELGPDALGQSIEFYVPQKRPPTVEEVVDGVVFLVSDLSRTITGTTLHVDGGTWAAFGFLDWPEGDSFMPAPLGGTLKRLAG